MVQENYNKWRIFTTRIGNYFRKACKSPRFYFIISMSRSQESTLKGHSFTVWPVLRNP